MVTTKHLAVRAKPMMTSMRDHVTRRLPVFPYDGHHGIRWGGWILNFDSYLAKVACLIKYDMDHVVKRGHVHTFTGRLRRAETMQTKKDRDFWSVAAPNVDAWMLIVGKNRDVFDLAHFVEKYPDILRYLRALRKLANVLVLPSRCPVTKAIEMQSGVGDNEKPEEAEEVPSQSYWTILKSWARL